MIVDSHCHLDRLKLEKKPGGDLDAVIEDAMKAGVEHMLCVGIDMSNADTVKEIASTYPQVFASVGVHPLDVESMTGLAAAGAQVIIMTTGRGSPTGNPISPVIKICGNPKSCNYMRINLDVDASPIITESKSVNDIADTLWNKLIKVCNGELTQAEVLGFHDVAIWRSMNFPFSGMKI